jgi:hypothetical protein
MAITSRSSTFSVLKIIVAKNNSHLNNNWYCICSACKTHLYWNLTLFGSIYCMIPHADTCHLWVLINVWTIYWVIFRFYFFLTVSSEPDPGWGSYSSSLFLLLVCTYRFWELRNEYLHNGVGAIIKMLQPIFFPLVYKNNKIYSCVLLLKFIFFTEVKVVFYFISINSVSWIIPIRWILGQLEKYLIQISFSIYLQFLV